MALNQFRIILLPKTSILSKYGNVPEAVEIDHRKWEKYWENWVADPEYDDEPDFEDALTYKWWKEVPIDIQQLKSRIDKFIPRETWGQGDSWKTTGGLVDHDVSVSADESGNYLEELSFRTDLTDISGTFIAEMLEFCQIYNLILMDSYGNLREPTIEGFFELAKKSNAFSFVSNPMSYFEKINETQPPTKPKAN